MTRWFSAALIAAVGAIALSIPLDSAQPDQGRKIELAEATQFCPVEAHGLKDLRVLGKLI